jgi:FlaA1/EpsC-like NDP-sugar epimerase
MKPVLHTFLKLVSRRHVPRWSVLLFDMSVVVASFYLAFAARLNFEPAAMDFHNVGSQAAFTTLVYALSFLWFGSYAGIIRHTGFHDAWRLFRAMGTAFALVFAFAVVVRGLKLHLPWTTSFSVLLIHFLLAYFVLMGSRVVVKYVYSRIMLSGRKAIRRVVIFGAGQAGILTRNALAGDPQVEYRVVAFVDDNNDKVGKRLDGVPVMRPEAALAPEKVHRLKEEMLVVSIQQLSPDRRRQVVEMALACDMEVKVVPPIEQWINGQLSASQLRQVRIEELLEREPIYLDDAAVARELRDGVVLITGAAGSIGSGLARQVLRFAPRKLVLLDQAETDLFELQFELLAHPTNNQKACQVVFVVADVRDAAGMERVFAGHRPRVVYHAAAYKHVPLMEGCPREAVRVNVLGTRTVADLAVKHGVDKFVMVSTDKAVNPTSVMGASKRIAEMYVQGLAGGGTRFVTTRFGNVLDSQGSVIPVFRKQIERGGPVTVTHRDIARYFMLIPEACQLVLEAGAMGEGGDILVFDMGEPVRIMDLARKMIRLSGLEPGRDIRIEETGLRPGEKLFEEVLDAREDVLPTHHPKILRARIRPPARDSLQQQLAQLEASAGGSDDFALVAKMKEIVPEYKSRHSVYEALDKPAPGTPGHQATDASAGTAPQPPASL